MNFNPEFSIGTIIIVFSLAASFGGFYYGTRRDLQRFKEDFALAMEKIEQNLDKLNEVILGLALSKARQDNYEKRTDETFTQIKEDVRDLRKEVGRLKGNST